MDRMPKEIAIFGAGCFWGIEQIFRNTRGVLNTTVGYAGGKTKNPTYREVCSGLTGHAEVVKLIFDNKIVSYPDLLKVFWKSHNPTTPNQQGADIGSQYRSIIFYNSNLQQQAAIASKKNLDYNKQYPSEIITEIIPETIFYIAENYHQQYLKKRDTGTCHI